MDGEFELVAGALSSDPARAKASAAELGLAPDRSYGSFKEMAKAEARRPDGIEAVVDRHAQPHALSRRQGLPGGRHPRHLRQAAHLDAGRRQEARRAGRQIRQGVRSHPQLHRLSDGAAGPRDGRQGRARRDPRRPGGVSAGLADRGGGGDRQQAGRLAHRPQAVGRRRLDRRHRHPCLQPRPLRLRPRAGGAGGRPQRLRARAGCSTTMPTSCCASRAAAVA